VLRQRTDELDLITGEIRAMVRVMAIVMVRVMAIVRVRVMAIVSGRVILS
jgi:hypothetical protein